MKIHPHYCGLYEDGIIIISADPLGKILSLFYSKTVPRKAGTAAARKDTEKFRLIVNAGKSLVIVTRSCVLPLWRLRPMSCCW